MGLGALKTASTSASDIETLIGRTGLPDQEKICCICEFDEFDPDLFQPFCSAWFDSQKDCDVKITRSRPSQPDAGCTDGAPSPDCTKVKFYYVGHSSGDHMRDFINEVTSICIDCPNVEAVISGCSTFENPEAAQKYLNSIPLPSGVTLKLWGAQCRTSPRACPPYNNRFGCTLHYGCSAPMYDPCPEFTEPGKPCRDSGRRFSCDKMGTLLTRQCTCRITEMGDSEECSWMDLPNPTPTP